MNLQVLICFTQIIVIYAITVPPVWPKRNGKPSFLPSKQQIRETSLTTAPSITHGQFQFPSYFPEDYSVEPSSKPLDQLQFRSTNNRNIYIYHPQANQQNKLQNHSPQSFQVVNFNNQNPDVPSYPKTNKKVSRIPKKKLPIVHQHLTEVTAVPANLQINQNQPRYSPASTNIKEQISDDDDDETSKENLEDDETISEHEHPRDVPTRPVYPGEGQWARFGLKHKPYISPNARDAIKVHETAESVEDDERPEGYETFERGEEQFAIAKNKFKNNVALFPQKHQLPPSKTDDTDSESEPIYKKPEIGFMPQKLYTQVRRTENKQHLPRSAIDREREENADKLREVIKDSILHTVYSEEGYEDSAYDHAGEEKNAENSEGHSESASDHDSAAGGGHGAATNKYSDEGGRRFGSDNVGKRLKNVKNSQIENFEDSESYEKTKKQIEHDAEEASSNYEPKKVQPNKSPTKEIKKVTLKNMDHDEINMEIHTEIKYTPQLKKHKYVKIIPSTRKSESTSKPPEDLVTKKLHLRVKRYDKDKLSKMYVRKHPTYYWKKNRRTTTTERSVIQNKQNFENAFRTTTKNRPEKSATVQSEDELNKPKVVIHKPLLSSSTITAKTTSTRVPNTTSSSNTNTMSNTTPSNTIPYTITLPSATKSSITVTTTMHSTSSSGLSPPRIVEGLHPDLMNPELTTKASKSSLPKTLPVKIRKFIKKRTKRYVNDYPNIKVDLKEFVDVERLPNPTEKADFTFIKYPYYNLPASEDLNENSPLRYAEDVKNIPEKVENVMSFYQSRNHIICPEVESDVNPVPDRVNQKEGEETDTMAEIPDLPRLKGLGDKIDCMKEKYFGESPLDSPFFQEEIIESPIPLFMIKKINSRIPYIPKSDKKIATTNAMYYKMRKFNKNEDEKIAGIKTLNSQDESDDNSNLNKRELKIKFLEPIVVLDDDLYESATINPIHKTTEAVLRPPYTLQEMMAMNKQKFVRFNPIDDFHQISLLEQKENKQSATEHYYKVTQKPDKDKFLIIYENQDYVAIKKDDVYKLPKEDNFKITKSKATEYDNSRFTDVVSDLTSLSLRRIKAKSEELDDTPTSTTATPIIYTRKPYLKRSTKKPSVTKLAAKSIRKPQPKTTSTTTEAVTSENKFLPRYYHKIIPLAANLIQTTTDKASTTDESATTSQLLETMPQFAMFSENPIKNPPLPEDWSNLNRRLSSLYNIFDITQYFSKLPAPNDLNITSEVQYKHELKPSEQMKVYPDFLKTINEDQVDSKIPAYLIETTTDKPSTTNNPTRTDEAATTSQLLGTNPKFVMFSENPIKNPPLPEDWSNLNGRLSSLYNIFDVTKYFSRLPAPNHGKVTSEVQYKDKLKPSEQMKVYADVLKTINEDQVDSKIPADDMKYELVNEQETSATEETPIEMKDSQEVQHNQNAQKTEASLQKVIGLVPPPNSIKYQQVYEYYNLNPSPSEEQIAEATKHINNYYIVDLKPPELERKIKLHRISKRATAEKKSLKSGLKLKLQQVTDDLLAEESEIKENYVDIKGIKRRSKRCAYGLCSGGSENKPVYVAPPLRSPKVYTEIIRRPVEAEIVDPEEEEEEDLNPRKRIYELKSTRTHPVQMPEEPVVEEVYLSPRKVIHELKPTKTTTHTYPAFDKMPDIIKRLTTHKPPVFYPVEENLQNSNVAEYIQFVERLKNKWSREDSHSTTVKPARKSKVMRPHHIFTRDNQEEPDFLQIIDQLHKTRKAEDVKSSPAPTAASVEITSANVKSLPVMNSNPFHIPDSFMTELKSMQSIFDHDNTAEGSTNPEVSRSRNYVNKLRTTIDTSKYKTIERNPVSVRHNLSSRYKAENENLPLSKSQTTQTPMIIAIITKPDNESSSITESSDITDIIAQVITETILEESETSISATAATNTTSTTTTEQPTTTSPTTTSRATTTTLSTTTTAKPRQRGRGRPRPTTTARPSAVATFNPLLRRRRPTTSTRVTTTTTSTQSPIALHFNRRRSRPKASEIRSLQTEVPANHKRSYSPISEESTESVVVVTPVSTSTLNQEEPKKQTRFHKVQERRVTSEVTLTRYFEPSSGEEESEELGESKKNQYEVVGPLTHSDTGHGGNYKYGHPESNEEETSTASDKISDVISAPESFFSDPNLAEDVNLLKDAEQDTSTEKGRSSNNLLTNEEIAQKVSTKPSGSSKVSLYPNMARMVNRLAESKTQEGTMASDAVSTEENKDTASIIKDPSRRMYYYAKL